MKFFLFMLLNLILISKSVLAKTYFFPAGNPNYKFIGRIDFTDLKKPTMWATARKLASLLRETTALLSLPINCNLVKTITILI